MPRLTDDKLIDLEDELGRIAKSREWVPKFEDALREVMTGETLKSSELSSMLVEEEFFGDVLLSLDAPTLVHMVRDKLHTTLKYGQAQRIVRILQNLEE